ncbi:MAG: TonB-dependent receptor, partial [Pseudomonadota bacterium]
AGGRGESYTLPAFGIAKFAAGYEAEDWTFTFFVDNLFNEFAEVGAIRTPQFEQIVSDINGDDVYARQFATYVISPRVFGARFSMNFQRDN